MPMIDEAVYSGTALHHGVSVERGEKAAQLPSGVGFTRSMASLSLTATQQYEWAAEEGEQQKLFGGTGGTGGTEPLFVHLVVRLFCIVLSLEVQSDVNCR